MDTSTPFTAASDQGRVESSSSLGVYSIILVLCAILIGFVGLFFYKQYTQTSHESASLPVPTTIVSKAPTLPIPTKETQEMDIQNIGTNASDGVEQAITPYKAELN